MFGQLFHFVGCRDVTGPLVEWAAAVAAGNFVEVIVVLVVEVVNVAVAEVLN